MEKLIKQVIELDKKAQNEISMLTKEKEELFLSIKQMRKKLTANHKVAVEEAIQAYENEALKAYEKRLNILEKKAQEKEKKIIEYYEAHKETWLDELLTFISGNKEGEDT